MNGESQWVKTGHSVKPPTIKNLPGRPAKKRRKDGNDDKVAGEGKIEGSKVLRKSVQQTVRCSACKQKGHNKRTCRDRHSSTEAQVQGHSAPEEGNEFQVNVVDDAVNATELSDHMEPPHGTQESVNSDWPVAPMTTLQAWPAWPRVETLSTTCTQVQSGGKLQCKGGKGKGKKQLLPPPVYKGPNVHGLQEEVPVTQYNTVIGGVSISSAKFTKNGHVLITTSALNQAKKDALLKVGEDQAQPPSEEAEKSG